MLLLLSSLLLSLSTLAHSAAWGPSVILVRVEGTIDSATAQYIREALEYASSSHYPLLIYLDTPGGYLDASLEIVRMIDESGVPVVAYAGGQWAISAGTLILLSAPLAYASPTTVVGSMQPVIVTPEGLKPVNESKIINTLVKIVEVHCKQFGRNCTAARLFITRNLNLDGEEAARYHVIDGVARSIGELIARINGSRVRLFNGVEAHLILDGSVVEYRMPLRYRIARVLSDPTISSLLLSIGSLILILSIVSGHLHSAPIGLLLLLLGLFGLGYNVNTLALILVIVGSLLLALELTVIPGFGVTGITGIIMIVLGLALLPVTPNLLASREYMETLLYTALAIGGFFAVLASVVVYKVVSSARRPSVAQPLPIGKIGYAIDEISEERTGFVKIEGEYWEARSRTGVIKPGERVRVIAKEGHVLIVERLEDGGSGG